MKSLQIQKICRHIHYIVTWITSNHATLLLSLNPQFLFFGSIFVWSLCLWFGVSFPGTRMVSRCLTRAAVTYKSVSPPTKRTNICVWWCHLCVPLWQPNVDGVRPLSGNVARCYRSLNGWSSASWGLRTASDACTSWRRSSRRCSSSASPEPASWAETEGLEQTLLNCAPETDTPDDAVMAGTQNGDANGATPVRKSCSDTALDAISAVDASGRRKGSYAIHANGCPEEGHVHPPGGGWAVSRPSGEVRGAAREVPAPRWEYVPRWGADLPACVQRPVHEGMPGRRAPAAAHSPADALDSRGPGGHQPASGGCGQAAEPKHSRV